ncbi:sulfatase [Mariniflexile sp.]|uniref:sulfatase family protein n=1 Tax=Mariniflexile sp. TaxID=1979402 RepID=UPI003569FB0D
MRNRFLNSKVILTLFIAVTQTILSQAPNYIIVLGDDISPSSLGCYNALNPNTSPNIDKLAKEGIKFNNMFVSQAVCGPTRAELYTGLQPHRNGCSSNHMPTKTGTLSIVHYLKKLGYRVGLTGKRHFSPAAVYPFEFIEGFEENANAKKPISESWDSVKEFVSRNQEQPFCLIICSVHAHAPWDSGDTSWWNLSDLKLPPILVDTQETRHYFREHLAEIRLFDEQVGNVQTLMKTFSLEQNTALIVLSENGTGMPNGKWSNYDWGVRSGCIMKFPAPYNKIFETNTIAQYCDIVPTLIDAAGGKIPENLDGKSLMPIISGKTNKHRENAFFVYNNGKEGTDFSSRAVTDGRFKLIWNLTPNTLFAVRVINGFDYGYIDKMEDRHVRKMYLSWLDKAATNQNASNMVQRYRKRPEYELYDLNSDPWELNNLADNPNYLKEVTNFKHAIVAWMNQQGDVLMN